MSKKEAKTEQKALLREKYKSLTSNENLTNRCVGFTAFNAIWGKYGKSEPVVDADLIVRVLKEYEITISDELANVILEMWIADGSLTKTTEGYVRNK